MTNRATGPVRAAALFGLTLVAAVGTVIAMARHLDVAENDLQRTEGEVRSLSTRLQEIERDLPTFEDGRELEQRLAGRGVLVPAATDRLLQESERAAVTHALPSPYLQFSGAPPTAVSIPEAGSLVVRSSTMHLRVDLGHELDLLAVTDELSSTASALPHVRACHLSRLPNGSQAPAGPYLHADCVIDWLSITLTEPS
jgi:hypothetical protein